MGGMVFLEESLRRMNGLRMEGKCPFCEKRINLNEFRDELSLKEYTISGLCQSCQDEFFKEE